MALFAVVFGVMLGAVPIPDWLIDLRRKCIRRRRVLIVWPLGYSRLAARFDRIAQIRVAPMLDEDRESPPDPGLPHWQIALDSTEGSRWLRSNT